MNVNESFKVMLMSTWSQSILLIKTEFHLQDPYVHQVFNLVYFSIHTL